MAKKPEEVTSEEKAAQLRLLKQALREKRPGRLYFFHGEEHFLLQHYQEQLKKILVDPLTESFNYHRFDDETFSVSGFADALENLPMMAEYTYIWVDDIDIFKLPEDDRAKLTEAFSDIPEYCTVLFTYQTVEWKPDKRFRKLWEAISKNGFVVAFEKQSYRELTAWVIRHFTALGKKISPELCLYLIDITGGTMTALGSEISKIAAYSGADTVVKSDIDAVTEPVLSAVVFDMTDLMGVGKYGPALLKLQQILQMQEKPIAILGAIGGHFRRLGTARTLLDLGRNATDLAQIYGIQEYQARKAMGSARNFSAEFCAKASELILEADRKLKTSQDDPKRILEMLVMELAREASHG